jgi:RNA-directed DNA polymerase
MERILAPENLHRAWRRVKANNGAPDSDGMRNRLLDQPIQHVGYPQRRLSPAAVSM